MWPPVNIVRSLFDTLASWGLSRDPIVGAMLTQPPRTPCQFDTPGAAFDDEPDDGEAWQAPWARCEQCGGPSTWGRPRCIECVIGGAV